MAVRENRGWMIALTGASGTASSNGWRRRGRSLAFALTWGNLAGITMAIPILEGPAHPGRLLADKAYAPTNPAAG